MLLRVVRHLTKGDYEPLAGHVFADVAVYNRESDSSTHGDHHVICTILGTGMHFDPVMHRTFDGIFVRFPDGAQAWKDRQDMLRLGTICVRADDPAIQAARTIDLGDDSATPAENQGPPQPQAEFLESDSY